MHLTAILFFSRSLAHQHPLLFATALSADACAGYPTAIGAPKLGRENVKRGCDGGGDDGASLLSVGEGTLVKQHTMRG